MFIANVSKNLLGDLDFVPHYQLQRCKPINHQFARRASGGRASRAFLR
jgi:hypothetical protein